MVTMLALYTRSGLVGSTRTTARSPPPIRNAGRGSVVMRVQLSPLSSERNIPSPAADVYPPGSVVPTLAYSRWGADGAMARLICERLAGRPVVRRFQVLPPSVDLKRPPPVPLNSFLSSQGPRRDCQSPAYTTSGCSGSMATAEAPVSASL